MSDWSKYPGEDGGPDYYYNSKTGDTSWNMPPEFTETDENVETTALELWTPVYDDTSGQYYYVNNTTQEVTWEAPSNMYGDTSEMTFASEYQSDWEIKFDETSNKNYYYNKVSGETQWENPDTTQELNGEETTTANYEAQTATNWKSDSNAWKEIVDPDSGKVYYYNETTGETQWAVPDEFVHRSPENTAAAESCAQNGDSETAAPSMNMSLFDSAKLHLPGEATTRSSRVSGASPKTPKDRSGKSSGYIGAPDFDSDDEMFVSTGSGNDHEPKAADLTREIQRRGVQFRDGETISQSKLDGVLLQEGGDSEDEDDDEQLVAKRYAAAFAVLDEIELVNSRQVVSGGGSGSGSSSGSNREHISNNRAEVGRNAVKIADILLSVGKDMYCRTAVLRYAAERLLNSHTMERFAEHFFVYDRPRGSSSSVASSIATTVEKLLSHQAELPKSSLTSLPPSLQGDAMACAKLIRCWMGDRKTQRPHADIASSLLLKMLSTSGAGQSSDLRDEVYCQIIRQTRRNPSNKSVELGWQLLLMCLISFPPSKRLLPFLLNHIATSVPVVVETAQKFVLLSLRMLLKAATMAVTPRREIPTNEEVRAALLGEKTEVFVSTLSSGQFACQVDSFTTAGELEVMAHDELCIRPENRRIFALYEEVQRRRGNNSSTDVEFTDERVISPAERVLDIIAAWKTLSHATVPLPPLPNGKETGGRVSQLAKPSSPLSSPSPLFKIVFKVRYNFAMGPAKGLPLNTEEAYRQDSKATHLLYDQALHLVRQVYYPHTLQDAVLLASLQLQATIGDHLPGREVPELRGQSLSKYVASQFLSLGTAASGGVSNSVRSDIEARILDLHRKLVGVSAEDARIMYLTILGSWRLYGSTLFVVRPDFTAAGGASIAGSGDDLSTTSVTGKDVTVSTDRRSVAMTGATEVVLSVGPRGVVIVDIGPSHRFLAEYAHSDIDKWGYSFDSFVLVTGTGKASQAPSVPSHRVNHFRMLFHTSQGKEVDDLLRIYHQDALGTSSGRSLTATL